ncbi:MAG: tRNA dihydrouridine synthase DusB [Firmicutes bacterium]|nr:tRNA dihydrouridine synthase DusB [Bacillota bacterium]
MMPQNTLSPLKTKNNKTSSFFIGKVKIARPALLAPMEHVTNSIFRRIVKPFGASLVFTEFCSSDGLIYGKEKIWEMVRFHESERPITIQIFGSSPKIMSECAKKMEDLGADILDINCGCSVPRMEKCRAGAYLAKDLSLLKEVMESVRKAVKIPVTIKIRKGWDEDRLTCFEIAKTAESIGFDAVTVHGRTSVQGYKEKADWDTIDKVARSVKIPVIGSGDITNAEIAFEKLNKTSVSGVMIGRGVMGNPWVFSEITKYLETGINPPPPSLQEKMEIMLKHFQMACEEHGEKEGISETRRHLIWYVKGLPNAASFRGKIAALNNRKKIIDEIKFFFQPLIN